MARISKEDAQRLLSNVTEEYVFRCNDGRVFRNMQELHNGLDTMTSETFAYHSNAERSDFSNWVRDVIHDEKLSRDLAKSQGRPQATKKVTDRITFLSSKLT